MLPDARVPAAITTCIFRCEPKLTLPPSSVLFVCYFIIVTRKLVNPTVFPRCSKSAVMLMCHGVLDSLQWLLCNVGLTLPEAAQLLDEYSGGWFFPWFPQLLLLFTRLVNRRLFCADKFTSIQRHSVHSSLPCTSTCTCLHEYMRVQNPENLSCRFSVTSYLSFLSSQLLSQFSNT